MSGCLLKEHFLIYLIAHFNTLFITHPITHPNTHPTTHPLTPILSHNVSSLLQAATRAMLLRRRKSFAHAKRQAMVLTPPPPFPPPSPPFLPLSLPSFWINPCISLLLIFAHDMIHHLTPLHNTH